jgi:drug/metabolite transporter superfamily protein YnfA
MTRLSALGVLFLAAVLEAGGDALVRFGLHAAPGRTRLGLLGTGAVVLFCYGYVVNTPNWDFGRLLGIYVVFFFFFVAQLIGWLVFNQIPTRMVYLGGAFIVLGGVILAAGAR